MRAAILPESTHKPTGPLARSPVRVASTTSPFTDTSTYGPEKMIRYDK